MLESQDKHSEINNMEYSNNLSNYNNDINLETPPSQLGNLLSNSNPNNYTKLRKNKKFNTKEGMDSSISAIPNSKKKKSSRNVSSNNSTKNSNNINKQDNNNKDQKL